jgi:hypothetical protein
MKWIATAAFGLGALALAACQRQVDVVSGGEVAPSSTEVVAANGSVLPSGSTMTVRLNQQLSTEGNKVGDSFTATVVNRVMATNGEVVIPAGSVVTGRITALDDSDNPTDRALIQLRFDRLSVNGRSYDFGAYITNVATVEQKSKSTGKVIERAAQGAAAGAVLGAIISGADLDAILKGGAIGATAGTVVSLGLGDVEHVIPAGTHMTLQSTQTVALR